MSTKKKKGTGELYVSLDMNEMAILRQLGWRERWFYLECKLKSDFHTGEVGLGPFGRERLTHEQLSKQMTVPPSRGRESDVIDGKEVARLLMRLQQAGLVGEIERRENKGLYFVLPLSPIDQVAAQKARQNKRSKETLPEQTEAQPLAEAHADRAGGESSVSHPVMTCSKSINNIFNTDGAGGTPAPRRVVSAPTPGRSETPTPGALSLARLKELLHEAWFAYVDTPDSERFYANWLNQGFSQTEFEEAIEQVKLDDSPTPAALDRVLRKRRVQQARPKPGRGRVAL